MNLVEGNFENVKKQTFKKHRDILEKVHGSNSRSLQRNLLKSDQGIKLLVTLQPFIHKKFAQ